MLMKWSRVLGGMLCLGWLAAQVPPQELIEAGHYKRAREVVEARYRANPKDAETLWLMARLKHAAGDLPAALDLAEKAVAADPKSAQAHFRLAEAVGDMAQKASMLHQLGLGRRFKKEVDLTLVLDPRHVGALRDLLEFYLQAPGIMGGDPAKARTVAEQIMKIDPVEGFFAQIVLARHDKQDNRVEELLRKAVEAQPASYDAHLRLGEYVVSQKKFEEAERYAREAVRLRPDRINAYLLLAAVLVQQDKWGELDEALAQAEKAVPDNLMPLHRAANNCLARKVELPRAERYLRKYLTQEPEPNGAKPANAHWRLGLVLEQQGRKEEAISELQTALKMDPNSQAKQDLKRIR